MRLFPAAATQCLAHFSLPSLSSSWGRRIEGRIPNQVSHPPCDPQSPLHDPSSHYPCVPDALPWASHPSSPRSSSWASSTLESTNQRTPLAPYVVLSPMLLEAPSLRPRGHLSCAASPNISDNRLQP